ncbi:unnamed protein product, partial [Durusdinium trenchii]
VGFSFIQAHSEGLFGKKDATRKDVELNGEAGLFLKKNCVLALFVVYAIMKTTPWARLSETVLQESITKFYTDNRLVPVGIAASALEQWSAKMSCAARKLVQKFRRIFAETPHGSKSDVIQSLKSRCLAAGVDVEEEREDKKEPAQVQREVTHEDLEELVTPQVFDWKAFAARFMEQRNQKVEGKVDDKKISLMEKVARPVATPARAHELPTFVVESMSQQLTPVAPFVAPGVEEDLNGEGDEDSKKPAASQKKKNKKAPKKAAKKAAKQPLAGPEVEEALAVVQEPGFKPGSAEVVAGGPGYKAGSFNERRKAFIAERRKVAGISYKEANTEWMLSDERAELLQGLPPAVLKRRRFA